MMTEDALRQLARETTLSALRAAIKIVKVAPENAVEDLQAYITAIESNPNWPEPKP